MIDRCARETVGRPLSHHFWTEDAIAPVEQVVLKRLPKGGR
jgi:hypothetical protein